ncbi:MAG: thioredoxin family protein [Candidatus Aenigmarchaeota archaeon]|nr:thioredoxin family protein [Candidatus Aenigmarchaeota archaeon]
MEKAIHKLSVEEEKEEKTFLAFVSDFCPTCKPFKEALYNTRIKGQILNIMDDATGERAVRYEIRSLPTAIFFDKERKEIGRAVSISDLRELISGS